jgi:hypothetical protein
MGALFGRKPTPNVAEVRRAVAMNKQSRSRPNVCFFFVCCVLALTILFSLGAGAIMLFSPSPLTPSAGRLFEEFLFFAGAGFFTMLGLLAAQSHAPDR